MTNSKSEIIIWAYEEKPRGKAITCMAHNVISTCPVCAGELTVTRLQCRNCGTAIEGEFSVGRFGRLGREQFALLESFLRARGNLKELERELKVSYPTVRARVDSLVRALGLAEDSSEAGAEVDGFATGEEFDDDDADAARLAGPREEARRYVLERLSRREISAEEAASAIRALSREK